MGILPDNIVFSRIRQTPGLQRKIDNLRADAGAIAECDADARLHRTSSSIPHDLASGCALDRTSNRELRISECSDVSLGAQTGDPAFLQTLGFQLDQFFLDFGPSFRERSGVSTLLVFDFENVVIAGVIDNIADSSDWDFESNVFERVRECFASDPAPIAAQIARTVLAINFRDPLGVGAACEFAYPFFTQPVFI